EDSSIFATPESNTTLNIFEGTTITKAEVQALGWNSKTSITLADWASNAPNVTEISPEATGGSAQESAFSFNNTLVDIVIPAKIKKINYGTFLNARNLSNVTFEQGSTLEYIGNEAFAHSPGTPPSTTELKIVLPESIISIGKAAFSYSMLKEITIPSNITLLNNNLFDGSKVETINFATDSQLAEIGYEVFEDARLLESINIPASVTKIGSAAFKGTKSLKTISIPDSITSLSDDLFEGSFIETINFGQDSKLRLIGQEVFKNATLLKMIDVPDTVTAIGDNTFQGTSSLTSITLPYHLKDIVDDLGLTDKQLKDIVYDDAPKSSNTGVIISSIVGAILVIAIGIGGLLYWKHSQNKNPTNGQITEVNT
ncbi:MAG: leucine-rich repeat domain-containing protein, partial [Metamycoplasmataceae bacterium]